MESLVDAFCILGEVWEARMVERARGTKLALPLSAIRIAYWHLLDCLARTF